MVITNAYIAMKSYGKEAARRGIHSIIGHDGPVMTDSGGYQVLEYGETGVDPEDMAAYEEAIGTDIAVPLDRPTGMGLQRAEAKKSVDHTIRISRQTISRGGRRSGARIWAGPVQGGEHLDLVAGSARALSKCGYGLLALGSPVEFMEAYRFADLARMILAARSAMPAGAPLHLFGAGHPLTIPLAVALGCDTFDSASYMLYARQGRYISGDATRHLSDIAEFSCLCPVCSSHTPAELLAMGDTDRARRVAVHNLHAIRAEVSRTRQAIHEGRLWEYVMRKSRAHPRLAEAAAVMAREGGPAMVPTTPAFKPRAVFLFDSLDQYRPEVAAYHRAARGFRARGKSTVCVTARQGRPAYASPGLAALERAFDSGAAGVEGGAASVQFCQYSPFLGIIPAELSDLYPAAHCVESRAPRDPAEFPRVRSHVGGVHVGQPVRVAVLPPVGPVPGPLCQADGGRAQDPPLQDRDKKGQGAPLEGSVLGPALHEDSVLVEGHGLSRGVVHGPHPKDGLCRAHADACAVRNAPLGVEHERLAPLPALYGLYAEHVGAKRGAYLYAQGAADTPLLVNVWQDCDWHCTPNAA